MIVFNGLSIQHMVYVNMYTAPFILLEDCLQYFQWCEPSSSATNSNAHVAAHVATRAI
jgi:hypothetical protein